MGCLDSKPKNRRDVYEASNNERQEPGREPISIKKRQSRAKKEDDQIKLKDKSKEQYNHLPEASHNSHNQIVEQKDKQNRVPQEDPKSILHNHHYNQEEAEDRIEQNIAPSSSHRERKPSGQIKNSHIRIDANQEEQTPVSDIPSNSKLFPKDADPALDNPIPEVPEEQNDSKNTKKDKYSFAQGVNNSENKRQVEENKDEQRYKGEGELPVETNKKDLLVIQQRSLNESRNLSFYENNYPEQRTLDSYQEALQVPLFQLILN